MQHDDPGRDVDVLRRGVLVGAAVLEREPDALRVEVDRPVKDARLLGARGPGAQEQGEHEELAQRQAHLPER